MADISVDKKGLSFSLSILIGLFFLVGFGVTWASLHQSVMTDNNQSATVSSAQEYEDDVTINHEQSFVSTSEKAIIIDGSAMKIMLQEQGTVKNIVPIQEMQSEQSPDALAVGDYTIDTKKKNKLSTVTKVRFPWYVTFGDRYAVHAQPVTMNGGALNEPFYGNQVTLQEEDARTLYQFAEIGTPVVVTSSTDTRKHVDTKQTLHYTELPATSASAYALSNLETGEVYLKKASNDRYPIASITKLVTATVATDVIGHKDTILSPDTHHYTLSDLYYPLLLRSNNAVAQHIAGHAGKAFFMSNMNAYTRALGMKQSTFSDASGLSPKNVSTVNDLLILAQHLYTDKRFIFDITREEAMTITSTDGNTWEVINQNKLASDPHFRGGKLGYTDEAKQTSLAVFAVPIGGRTQPIAVVVLHSQDWKQDTRTLLQWLVEHTKHFGN